MDEPLITATFFSIKTGQNYQTSIFETFDSCQCKAFTFRKTCKHVKFLKKQLENEKL